MAGENLRKTAPKAETIAGLKKWFGVKGGAATSREIVIQRTYSGGSKCRLSSGKD
jgi:hypothetical protein